MPKLTAIVPATDNPPTLRASVDAIERAADGPEELIVVTEPGGAGPAEARNLGAADATGEVLVFVDSDVVVHPDAFARIRAAFERDSSLVALFGSYDDRVAGADPVSAFRNLLHREVHVEGAGEAQTFWAGLGAVRREQFLEAGGFDARRYPAPAIEDIELGLRLSDAGGRIVLDPEIQGTHLKRWSLPAMIRTDLLSRGVPWVRLMAERRSAPPLLNLGRRQQASALASVVLGGAAALRRPRAGAVALAALVALNHSFYALLWRAGGPRLGLAGPGLHAIHHLTAAAAVPIGIALHLLRR